MREMPRSFVSHGQDFRSVCWTDRWYSRSRIVFRLSNFFLPSTVAISHFTNERCQYIDNATQLLPLRRVVRKISAISLVCRSNLRVLSGSGFTCEDALARGAIDAL